MKKTLHNRGFSVLFASLTGSLVLAIGIAILSITLKQITLASAGRESQRAFYAADSGTECALYLDNGGGNDSCPEGIFSVPGRSTCDYSTFTYTCSGVELTGDDADPDAIIVGPEETVDGYDQITTEIHVANTNLSSNPICFDVYVTKRTNDGGASVETQIESRGLSNCNTASTNRFERAIQTDY